MVQTIIGKNLFDCVGELLDATYENQFKNVLNIIFSNIIDNTPTQVYLLDQDNKPTETNVDIDNKYIYR